VSFLELEIRQRTAALEKELGQQKERNGLLRKENVRLRKLSKNLRSAVETLSPKYDAKRNIAREAVQHVEKYLAGRRVFENSTGTHLGDRIHEAGINPYFVLRKVDLVDVIEYVHRLEMALEQTEDAAQETPPT